MLPDLRFAFRQLAKAPGFTVVALLALSLGIAACTTVFTFYNALLVRPLPFLQDEASLVRIGSSTQQGTDSFFELSMPDFRDLRAQNTTLTDLLTTWNRTFILTGGDQPQRLLGAWITATGFDTLGVKPILGRNFVPADAAPGAPLVTLIAHHVWRQHFGGREDIVGQTVTLNGVPTEIVGVMPRGFRFPEVNDAWQPFPDDQETKPELRGAHHLPAWGRLKPGVTLEQAQAELATLGTRLAAAYPTTNAGLTFRVFNIRDDATRHFAVQMQLMLGAVIFVLLIACGNVANLLLARAATRAREIALRSALGATRGRLIRQFLVESLLLGAAGGALGLVISFWGIDAVIALITPDETPFWMQFELDWRTFLFTAGATLAASVLFGLAPALQLSRPDLAVELKEGGRGGTASARASRLRSSLVIAQIALALVLLVGAGLTLRSFLALAATPTGIEPENVLTFRVGLPPSQFKDRSEVRAFFDRVERELAALPGVSASGFISYLPLTENNNISAFYLEGETPPASTQEAHDTHNRSVTPGALAALRIPLLKGRMFDANDHAKSPHVALVDVAFAEKFLGGVDRAVGRRFTFSVGDKEPKWNTIVGVVGNVIQLPGARRAQHQVWFPWTQSDENFVSAVLRVPGDPAAYAQNVRDAVLAARADIPIYYIEPMAKIAYRSIWRPRFFGQLFVGFAGIALFLAAIGIYGVMAYNVSQRTQEIGVRMALGAQPGTVVAMVLRQGLRLVGFGLGAGLVASWFAASLLAGSLYGISPHDPPTFAFVPLLLAAVALLACWLPSRRAVRVDPMVALRTE